MPSVADIVRRFGGGYLEAHGAAVLPSHRRAIADLAACRTAALGGRLWACDRCGTTHHVWHSCRSRSCPQCSGDHTRAWLEKRRGEFLPIPYFHVTVTVPHELRDWLRRHQVDGYGALMTAANDAIVAIARDPAFVGGTVGVLSVLHTWSQRLDHHPHVHCLVTGGGLSDDGSVWHPVVHRDFLAPTRAIANGVRGRFRAAIVRRFPDLDIPGEVWRKPWVAHVTVWPAGEDAILEYLARYVFRIAITDRRILAVDDRSVTFAYKDRNSGRHKTCRISADEFLRRFLQHVLPKGFHKVRYAGLWHPSKRRHLLRLRHALLLDRPAVIAADDIAAIAAEPTPPAGAGPVPPIPVACPHCRTGHLVFRHRLSPIRPRAP